LSIGSRISLHASSPHSVALMQLRFASFAVANSREDFHLQDRAHAGRTTDQIVASHDLTLVVRASCKILRSSGIIFV
jgi:hypothetical protein